VVHRFVDPCQLARMHPPVRENTGTQPRHEKVTDHRIIKERFTIRREQTDRIDMLQYKKNADQTRFTQVDNHQPSPLNLRENKRPITMENRPTTVVTTPHSACKNAENKVARTRPTSFTRMPQIIIFFFFYTQLYSTQSNNLKTQHFSKCPSCFIPKRTVQTYAQRPDAIHTKMPNYNTECVQQDSFLNLFIFFKNECISLHGCIEETII
jgi:hypothetical protein